MRLEGIKFLRDRCKESFDTYTGKSYVWMLRDEKKGTEPYLFVQDPVNATGTTVALY